MDVVTENRSRQPMARDDVLDVRGGAAVSCGGDIRGMPSADGRRERHGLVPREPHEVGVSETEPDSAHAEAARALADEAEDELVARGFNDDQIRHWAEAYCREQRSGDLETFLAWIDLREHQS